LSDIRANTISDTSGNGPINLHKQSAAKAWVAFNGRDTVAINDSFNVGSVVDIGTGTYQPQFTGSFTNANYAWHVSTNNFTCSISGNRTTSSANVQNLTSASQPVDTSLVTVTVHGDLA